MRRQPARETRTPRWLVASAMSGGALALVACGSVTGGGDPARGGGDLVTEPVAYDCYGVTVTAEELAGAPSVTELEGHPGFPSFVGNTDAPEAWLAVEVDDERIGAIRPLDPPEVLDGEVRDHERLVVERMGTPGDGEADADGWMTSSAGPCALRAVLDGAQAATVLLAPDTSPGPDTTTLSLWVIEQACASGQPATDRVEVAVEETGQEVRLVIGVRPPTGDQACPSNPPTPVTVDLDEPLGGRTIVDAARLPPIEVGDAPDGLG